MIKPGEIIIYQNKEGNIKIDVRLEDETVWLTQAQLCELFQKSKATISEHISHIFEEGELEESSVVRNFRTTASDGKSYDTKCYNLDVIISVGYRVKSTQGTQFRIWATQRLKEYIVKGFALNEDEIKLLGLLVEQYLAFAETMAIQQTPMYMKDWIQRLDIILQMNGRELLNHAGEISHKLALKKSEEEYKKYRIVQKQFEKEQNFKELEADIEKLKNRKK